MSDRQAVDFLRRRYAAAILSDDADTACRLRGQLDRILNPGRRGRARRPETRSGAVPAHGAVLPQAERSSGPARFEPTVHVARPVTGLLADRRFLPRTVRSGAAPAPDPDPAAIREGGI